MKTVVIFGGSGFIGQNIIRRLAKKNYRILVPYQRHINNQPKLRLFGNVGQIIPLKFQSLEDKIIQNIIEESNLIINLKTIWQEKESHSYKNDIFNFNKSLVDLIISIDINKHLFFFSGLGVSENSSSKRTKFIAKTEQYISNNLVNTSIIRPSIVVGENDKFFSTLVPIFKFSFLIPLFGSGETQLQPVFVDDIARAVEIIIEKKFNGNHIYELVGTEKFSYKSLYQFISEQLGLKRLLVPIPIGLAMKGASIMEKIPFFNLITREQLLLFMEDNISSNKNKSFADLKIYPKDIREITKKIII